MLYLMTQDRLSTGGSFTLCDPRLETFPIMYASRGFVDLFGYDASECNGKKCGSLVGGQSILEHDPGYHNLAKSVGLSPKEVAASIVNLTKHIAEEVNEMMAKPAERIGLAHVVNRKKDGTLFVCEVTMISHLHPTLCWPYAAGLQHDVTDQISVKGLLSAALHGKHSSFSKSRGEGVNKFLSSMQIGSTLVVEYLNEKAGEIWQNYLFEQLKISSGDKELAQRVPCELAGIWRGTVSNNMGGYEQVLEFFADSSTVHVTCFGQTCIGRFRFNDKFEPNRLDILPQQSWKKTPKISCIAEIDGDVLHLCYPSGTAKRPHDFNGPGYCVMYREHLE